MMRRLTWFKAGRAVGIGLVLTLVLLALPPLWGQAAGPDDGLVVVQLAPGNVITRPISYTAPISGLRALQLTGLDVVTADGGFGPAVCSIEGVGCPASDCFCSANFWNYQFWNGINWEAYQVGAGTSVVEAGAVEGWAWGPFGTEPIVKEGQAVVQFDDSEYVVRDFDFITQTSGLDALLATGLDVVTSATDFGPAICSIEGVGCPASDCFCSASFWNYQFWDGSAWQSYPVGASSSVISQSGAVEGWRWGEFGQTPVSAPIAGSAGAALAYLGTLQQGDGGYGAEGATVESYLSIGANNIDATEWTTVSGFSTVSIVDYFASDTITDDAYANNAANFIRSSAAANGKLIVAVAGGGQNPFDFADLNLVESLLEDYDASTGVFGVNNLDQAYGIMAWKAAYTDTQPVPATATRALADRPNDDGGWGFAVGGDSDSNSTALMIQALRAGGQCPGSAVVKTAYQYLKQTQNDDGGFGFSVDGPSDANSTAYVLQALVAGGQDPTSPAWTRNGSTPYDFLLSLQLDDGSFEWQPGFGSNLLATQQAIPALLNAPFPYHTTAVNCSGVYLPTILTAPEG